MRKLELIIAIVMTICTFVSFVTLFFCQESFDLMMTTIAFMLSAATGLLSLAAYNTSKY
jgi:hypothetical protein